MKLHTHSHRRASLAELAEGLRQKAHRLTGPRQAILRLLAERRSPTSSKDLFARLDKGDCGLATIYRSLHLLEGWASSNALISATASPATSWLLPARMGATTI